MRGVLTIGAAGAFAAAAASASQMPPEALNDLPGADIVILGELHDNPWHHANQARAVRALSPAAIVFEMLTPDHAAAAAKADRDDPDALASALEWESRGWPDFAMYHPIFTAAPDAAIVGGGLEAATVRDAVSAGARAIFETHFDAAMARRLGLDAPLGDTAQTERESLQARVHCDALPEDLLPGMVEAQRLRDAVLAQAAIAAAAEGGPVVVITGNGHARTDWGVPAKLARAAPELTVLSIGQLESAPEDMPPYDRWIVSEAPDRDDPCAAFD